MLEFFSKNKGNKAIGIYTVPISKVVKYLKGFESRIIQIDFCVPFDIVSHKTILFKKHRSWWICSRFQDFLTGRKHVLLKGVFNESRSSLSGVFCRVVLWSLVIFSGHMILLLVWKTMRFSMLMICHLLTL